VFEDGGELGWPDEQRERFIDGLGDRVGEVFELTARILNYAHQATVRRMALTTPIPGDEADKAQDQADDANGAS
jgi:hypothetical protein